MSRLQLKITFASCKGGFIIPSLPAPSFICTALPLLVTLFIHLSSKVNGSSSAAYATVWLRGVALSTLAQQHAYITEHVLGVIQCASVYSGVITRLSSSMFRATLLALCEGCGNRISDVFGVLHFGTNIIFIWHMNIFHKRKGTFNNSPFPIESCVCATAAAAAATTLYYSGKKVRGQREKGKKTCAVQPPFCMHYRRTTTEVRRKRGGRGSENCKKGRREEKHSPAICGKRITQGLSVT